MKIWDKLWRREKGRTETVVCTNLKQTSTKYGVAMRQKMSYIQKRHIYEFICFSCLSQWLVDIHNYLLRFKERAKSSFIF